MSQPWVYMCSPSWTPLPSVTRLFLFLAVLGLHLLSGLFSSCGERGYLQLQCTGFSLLWVLWVQSSGFRSCSLQAQYGGAQKLWCMGLLAPKHMGSSLMGDQTHVPSIGRWILYHWHTRNVPSFLSPPHLSFVLDLPCPPNSHQSFLHILCLPVEHITALFTQINLCLSSGCRGSSHEVPTAGGCLMEVMPSQDRRAKGRGSCVKHHVTILTTALLATGDISDRT